MRHLKRRTLSLVIGTLGIATKATPNYVSEIPGAPSLTELRNKTLMGTAHIL